MFLLQGQCANYHRAAIGFVFGSKLITVIRIRGHVSSLDPSFRATDTRIPKAIFNRTVTGRGQSLYYNNPEPRIETESGFPYIQDIRIR